VAQKILQLYLKSRNPRETIELLDRLAESRKELKKAGYSGVYADTSNEALAKALERRGMSEVKTHLATRAAGKYLYGLDVIASGFPARHLLARMRRLVIRF